LFLLIWLEFILLNPEETSRLWYRERFFCRL
jgi:hypothetical protein